MSNYGTTSCGEASDSIHWCDPCDVGEGGNVRGVAFFQEGEINDYESLSDWQTAIASNTAIVIPETRGTYDGGTPTYDTAGFGDRSASYQSSDYTLNYTDPNYKLNNTFYNNMQSDTRWYMAWRTENVLHVTPVKVTVYGKDPLTADNKSKVYWEVEVKWSSNQKPELYTIPTGLFDCETNG